MCLGVTVCVGSAGSKRRDSRAAQSNMVGRVFVHVVLNGGDKISDGKGVLVYIRSVSDATWELLLMMSVHWIALSEPVCQARLRG